MCASSEGITVTDRQRVEAQVREVLATETSAASLSDKLFSPTGLFNTLAPTESERRAVVGTDLFRQAQTRFRELQQTEAAAFARAVEQADATFPSGGHRIKVEHLEVS
jgi:hypothetical protein